MRKLVIVFLLVLILSGCGQINNSGPPDVEKESDVEAQPFILTAEEYAAIRQTIPYEPRDLETAALPSYPFCDDETGHRLTNFISNVTFSHIPNVSFTSPQDPAGEKYLHLNALYRTRGYQAFSYSQDYRPELSKFIEIMNPDGSGNLLFVEHIERTAKLMYGDDFEFHHGEQWLSAGIVEYSELGGFYQLGVIGMGFAPKPVLLSYMEYDDRYETVAVFPIMEEGKFVGENRFPLNDEALVAHCNELERHYITIRKADDGRLIFYSHEIDETNTQLEEYADAQQDSITPSAYMATVYYEYLNSLGGEIETTASISVGGYTVKHRVDELFYYLDDFNDDGIIDLAISSEEINGNGIEIYTYQDGAVTKLLSDRLPYSAGTEIFTLSKYDDTYGIKYLRFNSVGDCSFFLVNEDGTLTVVFEEWLYDLDGSRLDTSGTYDKITPITFFSIEELEKLC